MTERRKIDPAYCTTEDIMETAGITRRTVGKWLERGLLPQPVKVSLGYPGGVFNRFPAWVLMQVRFIVAKRQEGLTLDEILELLETEGGFAPADAVGSRRGSRSPARSARRR